MTGLDTIGVGLISVGWMGRLHSRAYRALPDHFPELGVQPRLVVAAFRNALQWSEFQGGDLVVSPPFQWSKDINDNVFPFRPDAIDDEVPAHILDALRAATPEFARGYDVDGMTIDEFDRFGATVTTLRQFLDADAKLDALVRDIIVPAV